MNVDSGGKKVEKLFGKVSEFSLLNSVVNDDVSFYLNSFCVWGSGNSRDGLNEKEKNRANIQIKSTRPTADGLAGAEMRVCTHS